jgi:uncharacterized protein YidB (DUF937 family)
VIHRDIQEVAMGFLDEMASKAINSVTGGNSNPIAAHVMDMINQQPGGISGLIQNFHDKGMSDVVTSWVGSGQNLPISAEQIQRVLGSGVVQQLAAKAGISPEEASSHLAQFLPGIIDKLTPQGKVA